LQILDKRKLKTDIYVAENRNKNYKSLKWLEKWISRSEIHLQNPWQPADFANPCYKTRKKVRIFHKFAKYFPNNIETTHKKLVIILPLIYPKKNTLLGSPMGLQVPKCKIKKFNRKWQQYYLIDPQNNGS
jgi:hypothetical protein